MSENGAQDAAPERLTKAEAEPSEETVPAGSAGGAGLIDDAPRSDKKPAVLTSPRTATAQTPGSGSQEADLLQRLREFVESKGLHLEDGWRVEIKQRAAGSSAGTKDAYYFAPEGKRFRSRQEIARHLGLPTDPASARGSTGKASGRGGSGARAAVQPPTREEASAAAQARLQALQLPADLGDGVAVVSLGHIAEGGRYCTSRQLFPVGYAVRWECGPAGGSFISEIQERTQGDVSAGGGGRGDAGPLSDKAGGGEGATPAAGQQPPPPPPQQQQQQEEERGQLQEGAGREKEVKADGAGSSVEEGGAGGGGAAASASAAAAAARAPGGGEQDPSEEAPLFVVKWQPAAAEGEAQPLEPEEIARADTAEGAWKRVAELQRRAMAAAALPGGSAAHAQGTAAGGATGTSAAGGSGGVEPLPLSPGACAALCGAGGELELVSGWQRFGLHFIPVLQALEGLPGVLECARYQYVEQRTTWEGLMRELAIQARSKVKELEASMRKRKQADKASSGGGAKSKRAKTGEHGGATKAPSAAATVGSPRKASGAGASAREEQQIAKVLERIIKQVEASEEKRARKDAEKQAKRQVREAAAAERQAKKDAQKEAVAAERHAKRQADVAARKQHQAATYPAAMVPFTPSPASLDDLQLPGADQPPPPARPLCCGALRSARHQADVVEVWDFLTRWGPLLGLGRPPALHQLEAALAEGLPCPSAAANPGNASRPPAPPPPPPDSTHLLDSIHCGLMSLLSDEAFSTALEVSSALDPDFRRRDVERAAPRVDPGTWLEVARRHLTLVAASAGAREADASGGSGAAIYGVLTNAQFGNIDVRSLLQGLLGGLGSLHESSALLPQGAAPSADGARLREHAGVALAAALRQLGLKGTHPPSGGGGPGDPMRLRCKAMLESLARVKGGRSKKDGKRGSARLMCYGGEAAAGLSRSGRPIDLRLVAARVDAGVYSALPAGKGLGAFAADVLQACELWRGALKRHGSAWGTELAESGAGPLPDAVAQRLAQLMEQGGEEAGAAGQKQQRQDGDKADNGGSSGDEDEEAAKRRRRRSKGKQQEQEEGETAAAAAGDGDGDSEREKQQQEEEDKEWEAVLAGRATAPFEGCCVCWADEDRGRILLCDRCDAEYHTYCVEPALESIPEGEWYCPRCRAAIAVLQGGTTLPPVAAAVAGEQPPLPLPHGVRGCDVWATAAALSGKDYPDLSVGQRVTLLRLLCCLTCDSVEVRTQLAEAQAHAAQVRKRVHSLRVALAKGRKEAAAQAQAQAGQQQQHEEAHRTRAAAVDSPEALAEELRQLEGQMGGGPAGAGGASGEECHLRRVPLGTDRHHCRYWLLGTPPPPSGGGGGGGGGPRRGASASPAPSSRPPPGWLVREAPQPDVVGGGGCMALEAAAATTDGQQPPPAASPPAAGGFDRTGGAAAAGGRGPAPVMCWYRSLSEVNSLVEWLNPGGRREGPLRRALLRYRDQLAAQYPEDGQLEAAAAVSIAGRPLEQQQQDGGTAPGGQGEGAAAGGGATAAGADGPQAMDVDPGEGAREQSAREGDGGEALQPGVPKQDEKQGGGQQAAAGELEGPKKPESGAPNPSTKVVEQEEQEVVAVVSPLEQLRQELLCFQEGLPPDTFDRSRASPELWDAWRATLTSAAADPPALMACLLVLEECVAPGCLRQAWRLWALPPPYPGAAVGLPAVRLRLAALQSAVRRPAGVHGSGGGLGIGYEGVATRTVLQERPSKVAARQRLRRQLDEGVGGDVGGGQRGGRRRREEEEEEELQQQEEEEEEGSDSGGESEDERAALRLHQQMNGRATRRSAAAQQGSGLAVHAPRGERRSGRRAAESRGVGGGRRAPTLQRGRQQQNEAEEEEADEEEEEEGQEEATADQYVEEEEEQQEEVSSVSGGAGDGDEGGGIGGSSSAGGSDQEGGRGGGGRSSRAGRRAAREQPARLKQHRREQQQDRGEQQHDAGGEQATPTTKKMAGRRKLRKAV